MSEPFTPDRQIKHELSGGRYVTVQTDGDKFGLIFFNGEEQSKCLLSADAMKALVSSYAPLANGRGESIVYKWMVSVVDKIVFAKATGTSQ